MPSIEIERTKSKVCDTHNLTNPHNSTKNISLSLFLFLQNITNPNSNNYFFFNFPKMESIGSSSTASNNHHHHPHRRHLMPTQPLADRIIRAVSHHLRLLHHYDTTFFILGATGNVYTVNLSTTPSCSCPDRTAPCKHILFVFIRVLGVSVDDMCLLRRTLRPCELQRLLSLPISTESLANPNVRERLDMHEHNF